MKHTFLPSYEVSAHFDGSATREELLAERGMFAASEGFVSTHGGPLARRFLDAIPDGYRAAAHESDLGLNIDLRVHELLPGDFPASPGWHCDSPFREVAFDARATTTRVQRNLVATISSAPEGVSNTLFLDESITLESAAPPGSFELWREVDAAVNRRMSPRCTSTHDGEFTEFDCWTLHRASPAKGSGVRMFCRVSLWRPPSDHQPGLSRVEQVYRRVSLQPPQDS